MTKYDFHSEAGYFNTDAAMTDEQIQLEIAEYIKSGKTSDEARNLFAQNSTRNLGYAGDIQ